MICLKKLIAVTFLMFLSFQIYAESNAQSNAELITQTMAAFMEENNIPGAAIEIYIDGKPQSYYLGYANRTKKTPVSKNTIFEIGSISKIFTSLLLAQTVDSAKTQLADPVTKYITSLPANKFNQVTLRTLATYTAGLPFNAPESIKNETDLLNYFKTSTQVYSADDEWLYSNVSMGLLGMALESVTHQNYNQLYRTQILAPLKMQPIALNVPKKLESFYAQGYDNKDAPVKPVELGLFPAAYGIKLSASDMQRFLSAAIGLPGTPDRIFYPMRMTQAGYLRLPHVLQGLAWQIHSLKPNQISSLLHSAPANNLQPQPIVEILEQPLYSDYTLIDKTGSTKGFRAYIAVIPERKSGIAIMINKNIPNKQLVDTARKILLTLTEVSMSSDEEDDKKSAA